MTPKEKAEELIDKFTYWNTSEAEREGIKSALIAVEEIISSNLHINPFNTAVYTTMCFWQEVKSEIEKL
jgi:hypothetical protein